MVHPLVRPPRKILGAKLLAPTLLGVVGCFWADALASPLVMTTRERLDVSHTAFLEARRDKVIIEFDPYTGPPVARVVEEAPAPWEVNKARWHYQIRATVFWVGEQPSERNPTSNVASSWDPNWQASFGGYDHPFKRNGFAPAGFEPRQNPFYIALPYNDIAKNGQHRPEASEVIPWFWEAYRGPTMSVCEDRWIQIHHKGRVCFAQWKDVGPFTTDDAAYVFGGERPRPNGNQNAGIDLSPAVRDYLQLQGNADVDWRFVEYYEVRPGPWSVWLETPPAKAAPQANGP